MPVTIKSAREIELMRAAGKILGKVHQDLGKLLKPGMTTFEVDRIGEEMIRSYGCIPSFKNYQGYPASVCVSVNDEVVHGIPNKHRILKEGDIVEPGQVIGYVGSTGYGKEGTSGKFPPHLHFGLYKYDGRCEWAFNPYPHLRRWEKEEQ